MFIRTLWSNKTENMIYWVTWEILEWLPYIKTVGSKYIFFSSHNMFYNYVYVDSDEHVSAV